VIEQELFEWYELVEISHLKEFNSTVKMIEKHEENILNYFQNAITNAKAENMKGKIQRFITNNYGIRDKDFALYSIAKYFS
jgi:transposase